MLFDRFQNDLSISYDIVKLIVTDIYVDIPCHKPEKILKMVKKNSFLKYITISSLTEFSYFCTSQ